MPKARPFAVHTELGAALRQKPKLVGENERYEVLQEDPVPYDAKMGPFRGILIACDQLPTPQNRDLKAQPDPFWYRYRFILTDPPGAAHPKSGETYYEGQVMSLNRSAGVIRLDDMAGEELVVEPTHILPRPPPKSGMQCFRITRIQPADPQEEMS